MLEPKWWNKDGHEVRLINSGESNKTFSLETSHINLTAKKVVDGTWIVTWEKTYDDGSDSMISGRIRLLAEDVKSAFGLAGSDSIEDVDFAQRFGADCARIGFFIRKGDFLNLPDPGTGESKDPNVSIFLTPEIKKAVRKLTA